MTHCGFEKSNEEFKVIPCEYIIYLRISCLTVKRGKLYFPLFGDVIVEQLENKMHLGPCQTSMIDLLIVKTWSSLGE